MAKAAPQKTSATAEIDFFGRPSAQKAIDRARQGKNRDEPE